MSGVKATDRVCPRCDAYVPADFTRCWLCRFAGPFVELGPSYSRPMTAALPISPPAEINPAHVRLPDKTIVAMLAVVSVLAFIVGIGYAVENRGIVLLYLAFVTPALVAAGGSYWLGSRLPKRQQVATTITVAILTQLAVTALAVVSLVIYTVLSVLAIAAAFFQFVGTICGGGRG